MAVVQTWWFVYIYDKFAAFDKMLIILPRVFFPNGFVLIPNFILNIKGVSRPLEECRTFKMYIVHVVLKAFYMKHIVSWFGVHLFTLSRGDRLTPRWFFFLQDLSAQSIQFLKYNKYVLHSWCDLHLLPVLTINLSVMPELPLYTIHAVSVLRWPLAPNGSLVKMLVGLVKQRFMNSNF